MFRTASKIKLGRWNTEKTFQECIRSVDLANHDCSTSDDIPKYHPEQEEMFGFIPIGSFDLYIEPAKLK